MSSQIRFMLEVAHLGPDHQLKDGADDAFAASAWYQSRMREVGQSGLRSKKDLKECERSDPAAGLAILLCAAACGAFPHLRQTSRRR